MGNTPKSCVACGCSDLRYAFKGVDFDDPSRSYPIDACADCGTGITGDRSAESSAYSANYYGCGYAKFAPSVEQATGWFNRRRARWLVKVFRRRGTWSKPLRVLDVGCGRGGLLRALAALGAKGYGVERPDFPLTTLGKGIELRRGTLGSLGEPADSFQLVVFWHVLEHLEDPAKPLREARELLAPGGLLALSVPNFAGFQARLFGPRWFHLDLPRHIHHFTPEGLGHLVSTLGLKPISTTTWSLEQGPFGAIQSVLNWLLPRRANRLYAVLKSVEPISWHERVAWWALAAIAAPFAALEFVLSATLGRGAVVTLLAIKE